MGNINYYVNDKKKDDKDFANARIRNIGSGPIIDEADLTDLLNKLESKFTDEDFSDGKLPTLFQWPYGGTKVFLTGSFNNWNEKIELKQISRECFHRGTYPFAQSVFKVKPKPNTFYAIIDLPVGTYHYNFIVDDKWRIDREKDHFKNPKGYYVNVIEVKVSDFNIVEALNLDEALAHKSKKIKVEDYTNDSKPDMPWAQEVPVYIKQVPSWDEEERGVQLPPLIPPYLDQKVIHDIPQNFTNPKLLPPPPNHVLINHILTQAAKDDIISTSLIIRHKEKFVTAIYCSQLKSKKI